MSATHSPSISALWRFHWETVLKNVLQGDQPKTELSDEFVVNHILCVALFQGVTAHISK